MKLLILTPQLPYPPHQGTSLRNFNIIQGLSAAHQITLLSLREEQTEPDADSLGPLSELCDIVLTVPVPVPRSMSKRFFQLLTTRDPDLSHRLRSGWFDITLRRLLSEETFDVVQIEGIELAWTIASIRTVNRAQNIVFDAHNAEAQLQNRAYLADVRHLKRWPAAIYSRIQSYRLKSYESWACKSCNGVVAVSRQDKEILMAQVDGNLPQITVIPNSIDVQHFEALASAPDNHQIRSALQNDIVFTGKMDYRPNVDAVLWFADEVWPEIKALRPESTWAIVGQKPHPRLTDLEKQPGVTITGRVEDVAPY
ncbi:MAG: glycosyltransferase, partial [Candidatus Promineifilaceae bacterium]|nr:glycosyltransferase [Candidatus Promineifilaceae bacterium]